jgi:hypothetical protein
MLEFPSGNIFVVVGGRVFQQFGGIPMGTYCVPFLALLFFFFKFICGGIIQKLLQRKRKKKSLAVASI